MDTLTPYILAWIAVTLAATWPLFTRLALKQKLRNHPPPTAEELAIARARHILRNPR